jgi:ElaB/YqjD/DUF883 family membrane-anchored ribosome-binding protein
MGNSDEPIRIVIEEEDLPLMPETGQKTPDLKAEAEKAGQKAGELAQKAWDSEPRRKATASVKKGVAKVGTAVTTKLSDAAAQQTRQQVDALQTRVRETDWKEVARHGARDGLQWLSTRLAALAERLNRPTPPTPPKE